MTSLDFYCSNRKTTDARVYTLTYIIYTGVCIRHDYARGVFLDNSLLARASLYNGLLLGKDNASF